MFAIDRRGFLKHSARRSLLAGALCSSSGLAVSALRAAAAATPAAAPPQVRLGLVTYLWGKDWDLPTLLGNCQRAGIAGVELRTGHRHGVEPYLTSQQRYGVRKIFESSPVEFVGPGSNERFDHPDPAALRQAIERTKAFVKLSHDCGGSGVKVKPNDFHPNVPREKTIEQIGRSLDVVGKFAADYGQRIRLEVHGQCSPLPVIKQIMDFVEQRNVGVCWNSNPTDLEGEGLEENFRLVRARLADTAHVRELNAGSYPYGKLFQLMVQARYSGWILLECRTQPADPVAALKEQKALFEKLWTQAGGRLW